MSVAVDLDLCKNPVSLTVHLSIGMGTPRLKSFLGEEVGCHSCIQQQGLYGSVSFKGISIISVGSVPLLW